MGLKRPTFLDVTVKIISFCCIDWCCAQVQGDIKMREAGKERAGADSGRPGGGRERVRDRGN